MPTLAGHQYKQLYYNGYVTIFAEQSAPPTLVRETDVKTAILLALLALVLIPSGAPAGPSAEVARRCMRYAYIAYPYHRPGSVRMSGDRQTYFKNCMGKEGDIPVPDQPASVQGNARS